MPGLHHAKEWRSDCNRLLDAVDPYNQDCITFSDVVQLFTARRDAQQAAASKQHKAFAAGAKNPSVASLDPVDAQLKAFKYALAVEREIGGSVIPGQIHKVKSSAPTFAPNTGIASKTSLANISEESARQN